MGDWLLPAVILGALALGAYWFIFYASNDFRDKFIRNPDGTYKFGGILNFG